ncbi:MAG: lantibiotic dehydratase [Sphingobacterium sp.]|jgi:thiopeptide-type bacteriocin biosynthesis protein|nr:lantibiotic dehydratase [Sphingobacterium sp.]
MKLEIYPDLVVRVPQFPLTANLINSWNDLKDSIRYGSPDFYNLIKDTAAEDIRNLERPIQHSIWKYFNRCRYRATPYGSFAGFGIVPAGHRYQKTPLIIDDKQLVHQSICWTKHKELQNRSPLDGSTILFANSSYYKFNDCLRYLTHSEESGFEISEIDYLTEVIEVLEACREPVAFIQLMQQPTWRAAKKKLIKDMISVQLLLTDTSPNIIGRDYFKRLDISNAPSLPQYAIAERKVISGYPAMPAFRNLNSLIALLDTLLTAFRSPALEHFKNEYNNKFEGRHLPLMEALDPEIGISLSANEQSKQDTDFIASLARAKDKPAAGKQRVLGTLFIKSAIQAGTRSIDLENLQGVFESGHGKLPNSIGMLCAVIDDKLVVEHLGGATAVSVLGRYTIASPEIEAMCKDLADREQKANTDVLFFDIGYMSEIAVDNVNRRSQIYPLQLSILNYDTSDQPLTLDDLLVSVVDDEIRLYSKKWKKRMVPRLSTAYNYNRSDLPLFRFLCELQYQGLKSNLSFNLSDILPDQQFYPRLVYKNIIVSAAKWLVSYDQLQDHIKADPINTVKTLLAGLGIERYALIRTDDRTLCFDTESTEDMGELQFILKKFQRFYIEEGFVPSEPIVKDRLDRPYASQFTIALCHEQKVYDGMSAAILLPDTKIRRNFPAGSEWLYYDIYIHPLRADYLLQDKLSIFLKKHRSKIRCWFFLRYNKDGQHLRLRMKLHHLQDLGKIIISMADLLEAELDSGLISEFKISRYQRELERYSPALMEPTEHLFFTDSKFVLSLLSSLTEEELKYQLCLDLVLRIRDAAPIAKEVFDSMINRTCAYFLKEHNADNKTYKQLNEQYKKFKSSTRIYLTPTLDNQFTAFESEFISLLFSCPGPDRERLFTDLFHMHINRLFAVHQRTHEMIVYYFIVKRLQYEKAMLKSKIIAN